MQEGGGILVNVNGRRPAFYSLFLLVFAVGLAGFLVEGCQPAKQGIGFVLDAIYRSAQLFLVGFDRSCPADAEFGVGLLLNVARFGALFMVAYAAVALILPGAVQKFRLAWQGRVPEKRVVILGFDVAGQSIAKGLRLERKGLKLTAVHQGITPDLANAAKRQDVLLVEGDASDPDVLRRVRAEKSKQVIVALGDDMKVIDAAVTVKSKAPRGQVKVRAIINDPGLSETLPEAAQRGLLGANDLSYFSLPVEAARLLCAEARFDRMALEMRQPRVHLVVVGCGAQGEAVALETLLSGWRVGLAPPVVSIFDRNEASIRRRFVARAPALFPESAEDGALPLPDDARAEVHFHHLDIHDADFSPSGDVAKALSGRSNPTAWVFALPDDTLNLKAATALYSQMLRREVPSAAIRVRIQAGYQDSASVVAEHPITVAKAFGSKEETLVASEICKEEPDHAPRLLHQTYLVESDAIAGKGLQTTRHPAWDDLPETLKAANRRLYRQAVMKIEDLGLQWKARRRDVPVVAASLRRAYIAIEDCLDYTGIDGHGELPQQWWHTPLAGSADADLEYRRANRIKNIAIVEHNRWVLDRALDGWRLTSRPCAQLRDDVRRRHPSMHGWASLTAHERRYDAVLLRALISGETSDSRATAWAKAVLTAIVVPEPEGGRPRLRVVGAVKDRSVVTELRLVMPADLTQETARKIAANPMIVLGGDAVPEGFGRLCRIRFDFFSPPNAASASAANAIARDLAARGAGKAGAGAELSSLWRWGRDDLPTAAFAGVRDLSRVGGDSGLSEYLEEFFARRLATGRIGSLICGYAPGADRLAVDTWNRLGGARPELVFPYSTKASSAAPETVFLTTRDEDAGPDERVSALDASRAGRPRVARSQGQADGHVGQSLDLLDRAALLVVVYDGQDTGAGGVGYTVREAESRGIKVVAVERLADGWRCDDPDESAIDAELSGHAISG